MRLILLAALLVSACADPAGWNRTVPFRPTSIVIREVPDVADRCGTTQRVLGCAIRINESRTAFIFLQDGMPDLLYRDALVHELTHAAGYEHEVQR